MENEELTLLHLKNKGLIYSIRKTDIWKIYTFFFVGIIVFVISVIKTMSTKLEIILLISILLLFLLASWISFVRKLDYSILLETN